MRSLASLVVMLAAITARETPQALPRALFQKVSIDLFYGGRVEVFVDSRIAGEREVALRFRWDVDVCDAGE